MTTAATLAANKTVGIAFSLCFEGLPYVFCTGEGDTMETAFSGVTDFQDSSFYGGLHIIGSMGGKVSPWDPTIDPDSLDFTLTERPGGLVGSTTTAGVLASTFLKAGHAQTTRTFLETSVDCNDTTFEIQDQSVMTAATATAYIGNETISYTGKVNNAPPTADQLTGVTRGKFALHQTNTPAAFSPPHRLNDPASLKPVITNSPRSEHYGRQVMLRAHSIDPLTGAYDTVANALILWVGTIKSYRWNGDGTMTFQCEHVIGKLKEGRIFSDQFRAELAPGVYVRTGESRIKVIEKTATTNNQFATFLSVGTQMTAHEASLLIDAELQVLRAASSIAFSWTMDWGGGASDRHRITADGTADTAGHYTSIGLHPAVWELLGYDSSGVMTTDDSTGVSYDLLIKGLSHLDSNTDGMEAELPYVAYKFKLPQGNTMTIENARGTWTNQSTLPVVSPPLWSGAEGFVQLGSIAVLAVRYDSATQLTSGGDYSRKFAPMGFSTGDGDNSSFLIRADEAPSAIPVKQLWWEKDRVADVMLRFLLSTGTSAFNHATYDALPFGLGIGIPASLLNIPSFEALGDHEATFVLTGPEKFVDFFESQLAVSGNYCVWQDGKIALRPMRMQSGSIAADLTFTENNKASGDVNDSQRLEVDYSSDGLINRCVLEYNRLADGSFRDKLSIEDSVSVTDFGARKSLTVKGYSIGDVGEAYQWIDNVAASVLAFWSRPFARARRTFTYQEIGNGIACGDTVLLSDSGMIDPATGLHGVTSLPATLVGWSYDWGKGVGEAELILMPEFQWSRVAAWAPTARITSYVAATKVITCAANQYSHSSEAADATRFVAGDKVRLVAYSPANPAAPTNYQATVDSQTGNTVTLTTDPTAGAGLAGTFNLQFDKITLPVATTQKTLSFVADNATDSTGDAASDSYYYGASVDNPATITSGSPTFGRFVRLADILDNTAEPFSVGDYHDAQESLNGLLGNVTNVVHDCNYLETAATQTGTTYRLVYQSWLPCMGGYRGLIVALHGYHSVGTSSASFRITLSPLFVSGTSLTVPEWLGATDAGTGSPAVVTTNSTTIKALAETTFTIAYPGMAGSLPQGLWMSIEAKAGAVGETATLSMVNVREARL